MRTAPFGHRFAGTLLATTMLCAPGQVLAQDTADPQEQSVDTTDPALPAPPAGAPRAPGADDEEIVVTATRRAENLQDVPLAITAITTKTLEDLQVNSFEDYARLVPSLSFKSGGGGGSADGPGSNNVYFRGVASGENANHSSSLPSVGTYLDEQPITTIGGALDIHIFDIARVEALAGPQGTLYGASSQAGTVRIITNKPDLAEAYGAVNVELNKVAHGDFGFGGEGFFNLPVSSNAAARVVAWYRRDGGYIDNIPGALVFPTLLADEGLAAATFTNAGLAEEDYNDVSTVGARAALRIELNDRWTVTPQLMGQRQESHGSFGEERGLGKRETMQFNPEQVVDKWIQAALTVEGRIGNFDMTYAGSYMRRQIDSELDYVDYGYFYDALAGYGSYFYDNAGDLIYPNQFVQADDSYTKQSHELRFTSPADKPVRLVAGAFYQRQSHNIEQNYVVPGITDDFVVDGTDSDIWLTKQLRVDRDYAVFGELSYDIAPTFTVTAGGRFYKFDNSLLGFFGFNSSLDDGVGYSSNPDYLCFAPAQVDGSPCTNLDRETKDTGFVHRLNLTWKPNEDFLGYATWSRGFRPGGINRRGTLPPYDSDFITNYEAGIKYSFGRGAHFNMAIYQEDWDDIQISALGANGLTEIRNAGKARIRGVEADLLLRPMPGLTWSTGAAYNDAEMREDFCFIEAPNCQFETFDGTLLDFQALRGDRLPLTAKLKGSTHMRYEWNPIPDIRAHVQGVLTYEGNRKRDLRPSINALYGDMDGYALVDLTTGIERGPWSVDLYVKNLFDARGELSRNIQCLETTCGDPGGVTAIGGKIYTVYTRPRTIGLRVGTKF